MKRSFLALCAIVAIAGCGSSSGGTHAPISTQASIECTQILTCDSRQNGVDRALVASQADCLAMLQTNILTDFNYQAYLNDGSVRVDQAALSACAAASAADPCVPRDQIAACRDIYVGTRAADAPCSADVQCVSGACTAGGGNVCGTCLAPAAVGAACDPNNDNCATSPDGIVRCQPNGPGSGICVLSTESYLTVGLGQNCANGGGVRRYCSSPYYCDANDTCAERVAIGMPCDPNLDACVFGATCGQTTGGDVCLAVVNVTTAGQACGDLASGAIGRCDRSQRLYCEQNTNLCTVLAGSGGQNSDCFVSTDCSSGLVCVLGNFLDQPGTCETTNKIDGTRCSSDAECASQHCAFDLVQNAEICSPLPTCP